MSIYNNLSLTVGVKRLEMRIQKQQTIPGKWKLWHQTS